MTIADASGAAEARRLDNEGRATFGYLDQEPRFYGWMRGRDLLSLVADLYHMDRSGRRARIGEVLEVVGLIDAADRRIGGYSGGMRQRLGLAAALLPRPPVLFLDEPVSALDPAGRHDLLEVIARLRGTTTVVMSTHILNDVERVCERVGVLDQGRLLVEAAIDDLFARYAVPSYRVEPESADAGQLSTLASQLTGAPWVTAVVTEGGALRVHVNDPRLAATALFGLVADAGIAMVAVERQRPTLEDVFLRIVGGAGAGTGAGTDVGAGT